MRVAIVRHGDATTTRGKVFAFSAEIHDNGRKVALFGDQATCGNCAGLWKIMGTGEGVGEGVRSVVINWDRVLCPCGQNRVMARDDAGMFMDVKRDDANAAKPVVAPKVSHDEQVCLVDASTGAPLRNVAYRIVEDGAVVASGTTDAEGKTKRVRTDGARRMTLEVKEI
jgi:uncharacterized Zn-binding protein involved in type VI secretion